MMTETAGQISNHHAVEIPGWTPMEMLDILAGLVCGRQTVVEIGAFLGRSTVALAQACAGHVYAVDTWQGDAGTGRTDDPLALYREFLANVERFGLCTKVVPICQDSRTAWRLFARTPIDLLYVDGAHEYEQVVADLENWTPLIAAGGIVCGDDYNYPSVRKAVAEYMADVWRVRAEAGGRMFVARRVGEFPFGEEHMRWR